MDKYKLAWVKTLKVGDMVCDCRYRHLLIKEIYDCIVPYAWFRQCFWRFDFMLTLTSKWVIPGLSYVSDKDLILEDGAHCSALHCCSPVDHDVSAH